MGLFSGWVKVIKEKDFKSSYRFKHKKWSYALFRLEKDYYAIDDRCSHEEASLSEGEVTGTEVICPRHGAHFDIKTGEVKSPPATQGVGRHEVKVERGNIYINVKG